MEFQCAMRAMTRIQSEAMEEGGLSRVGEAYGKEESGGNVLGGAVYVIITD